MPWPLWIELLLRSAVLLGAAELVRRFLRHKPAAMRHKLLVCTFLLLAALPVLLVFLPEIHLPLPSTATPRAGVSVTETLYAPATATRTTPANWPVRIWLGGILCALCPLLIGAIATRRMVGRAQPMANSPGSSVPILLSKDAHVPLTCGIFKPRILLPLAARHWTPLRLRAVVLHELAHIERRDVLVQCAAQLVVALWWFQPLVWLLRRKLRLESELACDSAALGSGLLPSQYAAELIAIAQSIRHPALANFAGIGMARGGDLETRVRSILNSSGLNPSGKLLPPARMWSATALLIAITVAASTLTATTSSTAFPSGGLSMKRTLIAAVLASTGLSAATITGSILDSSGATLPDAKLTLSNPDTGQKLEAVSGQDGKFALPETPAGDYILRVDKTGFKPLLREFNLKDDSAVQRALTLDPEPRNSPASAASGVIRVGGRVAQSNLVHRVQPIYPAASKQARVQGTVELQAHISKEGVPLELQVLRSPGDDFSESTLEAVRQWRYRPVLLNGNPVEIVTDVIVNYTLNQ